MNKNQMFKVDEINHLVFLHVSFNNFIYKIKIQ